MPLFAGANWHERECWEMFGITFDGHPGLRHLYLPGEFEGHPLRKDFPLLARLVKPWPGIVDVEPMPAKRRRPSEAVTNPTPPCRRRGMTAVTERQQLAYVDAQAADARVNVEVETDEGMILNIGPQHPATHGTLRVTAKLDGEQVVWADVVPGYMHRGYEKLTEVRTYPQVTTLVNRIDWLGSFANEVPFILAAEQLMDIEAPPRARTSARSSSRWPGWPTSCCSSATWASSWARSRRRSSPSATASTSSTRSSRSPAAASTPTSTASAA